MSMLEVACGRCNKRFRVRAEFAGKTTRCPGCSAPLVVGVSQTPAPPPADEEELPRRRSRPRDVDDRPSAPQEDWSSVDTAFRREQTCLVFIVVQVVCDLFVFCAGKMIRAMDSASPFVLLLLLLFGVGPSIGAVAMGLMARAAALSAPRSARVKGTAIASLLCGFAAVLALVAVGLLMLMGLDGNRVDEDSILIPIAGMALAGLGAIATFSVYVAQVGIIRQAKDVSLALGRTAIAGMFCVVLLIGGACVTLFLATLLNPNPYRYNPPNNGFGPGYGYQPSYTEPVMMILLVLFLPLVSIVMLIMYHRLLAAGRRALRERG